MNLKPEILVSEIKNAEGLYELFKTTPVSVTTIAASDIGSDSATLNLTYPAGDYIPEVRFSYKKADDDDWMETDWTEHPGSQYALPVTDLDFGTTYYFKAHLRYNATEIEGDTLQFTTVIPNTLGSLQIGDRVEDPSWEWEHRLGLNYSSEFFGFAPGEVKPVRWIIVARDHYGTGTGLTLLAEELIGLYAFDNSTDRGSSFGSNHWGESGTANATRGLRPWLNSSTGFYRAFSSAFKANVVEVNIPNRHWEMGEAYSTQDRVFIPSTTELGDTSHVSTYEIGSVYPYFFGAGINDRVAQLGGNDNRYWTRSPDSSYCGSVINVYPDGFLFAGALYDDGGVRPALNMKPETPISETSNDYGVYELLVPMSATVTTTEASEINTGSATLNLTYTADDFTPEVRFAYREDGDEDWTESDWVAEPGSPYALTVTGLDPGTTYDFRAQLKYNDTVIEGDILSFSTLPDPGPVEHTTIYWQNTETGLRYLWFMDGLDLVEMGGIGTFGAGVWDIVGVGDLDGDGKTDIVWHNTETGLLYYWLMDGRSQLDAGGIGIVDNSDWRATAVGDMNGNGSPDIIWENTANGRRLVWFMDGVDNVGQEFLAEQPDPTRPGLVDCGGGRHELKRSNRPDPAERRRRAAGSVAHERRY